MEGPTLLADMLIWAGKNTAHNLDFIPDDRLDWKPEPTAKSAFEIVQHTAGAMLTLRGILTEEQFVPVDVPLPQSRDEAKKQLVETAEACAAAVRAVKPEAMGRTVNTGFAEFPISRWMRIALTDMIHHHGQIAYLQTMLGDNENHFDPSAF